MITYIYARNAKRSIDKGNYDSPMSWAVNTYGQEQGEKIAKKIMRSYGDNLELVPDHQQEEEKKKSKASFKVEIIIRLGNT